MIETAASQAMTATPPRPPRRLIVPLVVAALALLSGVPVIAIGSSGSSTVWATLAVLACALISVLVTRVRRDAGLPRTRHAQQVHDRRLEER